MSEISVIIPAYNSEKHIEEAIESLFAQSLPVKEIIVIDDGSTDGTASLVKKHGERVSYYFQENRGLAAARNTGIRKSTGYYLAFLDADDLYLPEKIEVQKRFLDDHPDIDMVFSDFEYFGGTLLRRPIPESFKTGKGDIFLDLFRYNCIAIPTVLIRRDCFEEVGFFDELLRAVEDYDLWLRLIKSKKIGYIDRVLAKVRLHPENMSKDAELMCEFEIKVMHKALRDNPYMEDHFARFIKEKYGIIYFESGYRHLLGREMKRARHNFTHAMMKRPLWIKPYIYYLASFGGSSFLHTARKVKRFITGKR